MALWPQFTHWEGCVQLYEAMGNISRLNLTVSYWKSGGRGWWLLWKLKDLSLDSQRAHGKLGTAAQACDPDARVSRTLFAGQPRLSTPGSVRDPDSEKSSTVIGKDTDLCPPYTCRHLPEHRYAHTWTHKKCSKWDAFDLLTFYFKFYPSLWNLKNPCKTKVCVRQKYSQLTFESNTIGIFFPP